MSWILARIRGGGSEIFDPDADLVRPLFTFSRCGLQIRAGGNPDTCFYDSRGDSGWVSVGTGVLVNGANAKIMSKPDWGRVINEPNFNPQNIDGHFVILRWNQEIVECFVDQLGLRTAYFATRGDDVVFSTRLDWVAHLANRSEVDFAALGSPWLMFNQIGHESGIVGVDRVGPGGYVRFCNAKPVVFHQAVQWSPFGERRNQGNPDQVLSGLLSAVAQNSSVASLGLSGGMDSRLLLSVLSAIAPSNFVTHTFGEPDDPDVQIARKLCELLGAANEYLTQPLPAPSEFVQHLSEYAAQTFLAEPVTSFMKLRLYSMLRDRGRFMVDGGFGEIARRQYLNRVIGLGRDALFRRDAGRLFPFMRSERSTCFDRAILKEMRLGAQRELQAALDGLPDIGRIGVENAADLLAVRTRLPNYGGPEQGRLDGVVRNIMPLVQPSFLRAVLNIPIRERRNGKFYRNIILRLKPALAQPPLAKAGMTHSFGLSTNFVRIVLHLKNRLGERIPDPWSDFLLSHIQEFVLDVASSKVVSENPYYDSGQIQKTVSRYYGGDRTVGRDVAWWITFHFWHQALLGKNYNVAEPA